MAPGALPPCRVWREVNCSLIPTCATLSQEFANATVNTGGIDENWQHVHLGFHDSYNDLVGPVITQNIKFTYGDDGYAMDCFVS